MYQYTGKNVEVKKKDLNVTNECVFTRGDI